MHSKCKAAFYLKKSNQVCSFKAGVKKLVEKRTQFSVHFKAEEGETSESARRLEGKESEREMKMEKESKSEKVKVKK